MEKKTPKRKQKPLDYQTAKFLWAVEQMVPNNPHIPKEARRVARVDPIQAWHMSGGWGVTVDDVLAAIYVNVVVLAVNFGKMLLAR